MTDIEQLAAILRKRTEDTIARLRHDLGAWIDEQSGVPRSPHPAEREFSRPYYTEISVALLETAIDRYISLHDAPDAFTLIKAAFDRQAAKKREALQ